MNVSVEEDGSIYCVPVVKTKLNMSFSVVAHGSTTEKPRCILSLSVLSSHTHFMNVSVEEDGSIYCVPVVKTKLNMSFSVVAHGSTTEKPRCILSLSVLSSQTFGD